MALKAQNGGMVSKSLRRWQVACTFLLLGFLVLTGRLLFVEREYEHYIEKELNDYPFIDPARNFIDQENFIVNIQSLRESLRALEARERDNYTIAIYFEFLNTGANIAINTEPEDGIWPASLAKVPLAIAVMKKVEDGVWKLENELILFEQDKDRGSGALYNNTTGTRFTIEELLKKLLQDSDNTAYRILLRNMQSSELAPIVEDLGLEALFQQDGRVTAKEYSRIFRSLYNASFLRREYSQRVLQWLSQSSFNEFLSSGVSDEVPFAHKWGSNAQYMIWADAGIVYIPFRPYLLTVMIAAHEGTAVEHEQKVRELMREISKEAFDYFNAYEHQGG